MGDIVCRFARQSRSARADPRRADGTYPRLTLASLNRLIRAKFATCARAMRPSYNDGQHELLRSGLCRPETMARGCCPLNVHQKHAHSARRVGTCCRTNRVANAFRAVSSS